MIPINNNLKPVEEAAKELTVSDKTKCSTKCYYDDLCLAFVFSKNDGVCSIYNRSLHSMAYEKKLGTTSYEIVLGISDCNHVMLRGHRTSGVYAMLLHDGVSVVNAYCEISTDEIWLVIQRRTDGSEDFDRTWNEYKDGFGDLDNEFWFGNTNIHLVTSQGDYDLRIEVENKGGKTVHALYENFSLSSEKDYFRLNVGNYIGNAGDSLTCHNGCRFSTKDMDHDTDASVNFAARFKGGWWFADCLSCNLNGVYLTNKEPYGMGVMWSAFRGHYYSMKRAVMKIRPMRF